MVREMRDVDERFGVLERACAATSSVLRAVRPEQMRNATALAGWDVHELVRHLIGCASFFADTAERGVCHAERRAWPDDAAGDITAEFARESGRLLRACAVPGVLNREVTLPSGPATGALCLLVAAGEIFVHGWDVARATGQSTDLAPEVAAYLRHSQWAELCNVVRANEPPPFAPARVAAAGAPEADQLAAFLGRSVESPATG